MFWTSAWCNPLNNFFFVSERFEMHLRHCLKVDRFQMERVHFYLEIVLSVLVY